MLVLGLGLALGLGLRTSLLYFYFNITSSGRFKRVFFISRVKIVLTLVIKVRHIVE